MSPDADKKRLSCKEMEKMCSSRFSITFLGGKMTKPLVPDHYHIGYSDCRMRHGHAVNGLKSVGRSYLPVPDAEIVHITK
jgi:hypothetical protein